MTRILLSGLVTVALALVLSALLCAPFILLHIRWKARRRKVGR